ncbi:hypothetical protein [Microcoleus sp. Pol10D4]|uniref:hypothetical protein n=1 Tax=Microcoleus sp. Pol10D4 TaxID=3055387 RepID=UPI002FCF2807
MSNTNDFLKTPIIETENNSSNTSNSTPIKEQPSSSIIKISKTNAIISNTCLLVWAILLAVIGMQAVSGKASTIILEIAEVVASSNKSSALGITGPTSSPSPLTSPTNITSSDVSAMLNDYIKKTYPGRNQTFIPPISIVLDRLQVSVNWRDADEIDQANGDNRGAPNSNEYNALFDIVAKRLEAIADFSPEVSVSSNFKINNNIIPLKFRATNVETGSQKFQKFQEQEIDLPVEAILWVKARQASATARKSQISFLDLFILLLILGGFGSWIYLVRRHIDPSIKVDLYEYFYRPPLGMTLAIAVFIVNISLHSFVSTSNINQVRRETLILLAFAAGLLSDKTYEFIEKVAGKKLDDNHVDNNRQAANNPQRE